jgi:hypothetical protein
MQKKSPSKISRLGTFKAALTGSIGGATGIPPKKAQRLKKGKTLTLCSNLEVAEGCNVGGDEVDDE